MSQDTSNVLMLTKVVQFVTYVKLQGNVIFKRNSIEINTWSIEEKQNMNSEMKKISFYLMQYVSYKFIQLIYLQNCYSSSLVSNVEY